MSIIAEAADRLGRDAVVGTRFDWNRFSALGDLLRQPPRTINGEAMWQEITTSLPLAKQFVREALKG